MAFQIPGELVNLVNLFGSVVPNKIVVSLLILIVGLIAARIIQVISLKIARKLTKKTKTKIDDMIFEKIRRPIFYVLVLIVFELAIIPVQTEATVYDKIINSIVVILITYVVLVIFEVVIDMWGYDYAARTESQLDEAVLPLLHKFSKVFFVIIGLLFVLGEWDVQISPILASLGIAGIAVAFALQSTLGNIFGGVSLILDKTVKVGDRVVLEDGVVGEIIDVGLRSTKIRTFDNEVIIFPNGKLADSKVQNLVLPTPASRVGVDFGVEYGSDPDKVEKVVLNVIKKLDTLNDPEKKPAVWFLEMGDFALKFRAVFWVKDYKEKWMAKINATKQIYTALRKNKIGIPFPTRTVYIHKAK